jgi:beta-N-acetylhexosaminidase
MSPFPVPALFCVGFDGLDLPDHLRPLLAAGLSGVILFRRNLQSLEQICRLTADLHAAASAPLLVGVDQEGGRVTRLPAPFLTPPPAATLGELDDPVLTEELARAVGRELGAAGFTWNLAPVLDVNTNSENPVIGDRAFSRDPERVARHGLATIRGLTEAGILPTAKHFPGHGDTAADSHRTLPESPQPAARWRAVEFVPFRQAIRAGVPMIMTAHLACSGLDPRTPSSLSHTIITDILRGELGFDGVVVSDDLEMNAIATRFDIGEAAVRFFEAGGDLILICQRSDRQRAALEAVEAAVRSGRLSESYLGAALRRLDDLRRRLPDRSRPTGFHAASAIVGSPEHQHLMESIRTARAHPTSRKDAKPSH